MPPAPVPGEPEASAAAARRWTVLGLLALISATHQFHRSSLPALENQVMEAYSIDPVTMGKVLAVFFFTYTMMMVAGGWLADRAGTWWTLLLVVAGSGFFGALTGLSSWLAGGLVSGVFVIALSRAGMGIFSAPLYPSTSRAVGGWFAVAEQPWANAVVTAAAPLGIFAAFPVMSRLSGRLGWEKAFIGAGAATTVVLLLWALLGRSGPHAVGSRAHLGGGSVEAPPPTGASWLFLLRHRGLLALTASYFAVGYFEYVLMSWLKHYFKDVRELSEDESALYAGMPNLAMMLGSPLGGLAASWCMRRLGLRRGLRVVPMASMGLAAVFLALGALAPALWWTVTAFSLAMGFIGAAEGPFWTAAVRLGGRHGATAAGILNTGGNIPGCIATVSTPWIAKVVGGAGVDSLWGWNAALLVASAICLGGVLFWCAVDAEKPAA